MTHDSWIHINDYINQIYYTLYYIDYEIIDLYNHYIYFYMNDHILKYLNILLNIHITYNIIQQIFHKVWIHYDYHKASIY